MTAFGTKLYTMFTGKKLGEDEFGNSYYTNKKAKRWVVYKGIAEASKVPAEWHRWLHRTTDEVPTQDAKKYAWEKPHQPNLTGTEFSYAPKGHVEKGGKRDKVVGDYEAWKPE